MAEWLVEDGIGETRAIRLEGDRIAEARVEWPGRVQAGWIVDARLTSRRSGNGRGTATVGDEEILVDRLPRDASEGAPLRLAVTRAAFDGPGRFKRAQARPTDAALAQPKLAERLATIDEVRTVRRFPGAEWDDLVDEALSGEIAFAGGTLWLSPTPALTAIDVDGDLAPAPLALAAVPAVADALRRLDIAGSIAIDFPTLAAKPDRRAVDDALAAALEGWPHERTAMNGFGLVQIVARAQAPSLLQLAAWRRGALVWRRLLRRAEALEGAGMIELAIHPALRGEIAPDHLTRLERRSGRRVAIRDTETLALEAPHAQLVPDDRHAP